MPDGASCVDDELLFALAQGALAADELAYVEAHLSTCADCRSVLAEAARSLAPARSADSAPAISRVGRYEVQGLIGAGTAGVVYRAFDPNLKRAVALKVLRPDVHGTSPQLAQSLLREAQAMARLSAPQVVSVYDVGIENGAVYLVMEHVQGADLKHWLTTAPRSTDDILRVFLEAGRGLLAAHEKGLVHLDFKPANVLVAEDGRALVTDFGLAREAGHVGQAAELRAGESTSLYSPTVGLVGTPAYMAPELFEGGRPSKASDQYAFCVALFSTLFGRHPFGAGDGINLDLLVLRASESAPLSKAELHLSSRRLERLHTVLTRGLAPQPDQRYADMGELLGEIERAGRSSVARRRMVLAAVALCAAGALGWVLVARQVPREVREKAVITLSTATPHPVAAPVHVEQASAQPEPKPVEPVQRAHPRKSTSRKKKDVRYRDGLKDPF